MSFDLAVFRPARRLTNDEATDLYVCCQYARADEIAALVHRLAVAHGLAVYDPQTSSITYPA